jgi:hypothetical protein
VPAAQPVGYGTNGVPHPPYIDQVTAPVSKKEGHSGFTALVAATVEDAKKQNVPISHKVFDCFR